MRWHNQTVHSGGVRLAVRDSDGDGATAVLLHGLGAPQRSWDRVAPLLVGHPLVACWPSSTPPPTPAARGLWGWTAA
jgi:pimeloyl-ACP methyl ester carboxylesterase